MSNLGGFLLVGVLVVGFVVFLLIRARMERQREQAFVAFSESHAFQYVSWSATVPYPYASFSLFKEGHSQEFRHQMSGTVGGHPFVAFEFAYVTGYGRNSETHAIAVMGWQDLARMPDFTLAPETWFNRVAQKLGASDIDFPDDPAFSQAYVLKATNPNEASALFTSGVRTFLTNNPGQHMAGELDALIWWRPGALAAPPYTDSFLSDGSKIRALFN